MNSGISTAAVPAALLWLFTVLAMTGPAAAQDSAGNHSNEGTVSNTNPVTNKDGFRLAMGSRRWKFPRDHGQHPDYKVEWWYYTGNLRTEAGRSFGYQVTFFRFGLSPSPTHRQSAWGARSLYMAHAALSDIDGRRFLHEGGFGRESLGLSGASAERHKVWMSGWRAEPIDGDPHGTTLIVPAGSFRLQLQLRALRPPVLHGKSGLDQKGPRPGQASWYYSQPRLETRGWLETGGERYTVTGVTWMDHEFSSNQLAKAQVGWDWFAIHLDDGSDVMIYRLRRKDGSTSPYSGGSLIAADGTVTPLWPGGGKPGGFTLAPGRIWRSPDSGGNYPLTWEIALHGAGLKLNVQPAFDTQELLPGRGIPFPYWEGAIRVTGTRGGRPVSGEGYMELTGYAGEFNAYFE